MARNFKEALIGGSTNAEEVHAEWHELGVSVDQIRLEAANFENTLMTADLGKGISLNMENMVIDNELYESYSSPMTARYVVNGEVFIETAAGDLFNVTKTMQRFLAHVESFGS